MPKVDNEVTILALILDGQKELREDLKEISNNVAAQGANVVNISTQMVRVLDTLEDHSRMIAEHSEKLVSLDIAQDRYYRYSKNSSEIAVPETPSIEIKKSLLNFPPQTTPDILKFIFFSLLSLGAVIGGILKAFGVIEF